MKKKQPEQSKLPPLEIPSRLTYLSVYRIKIPSSDKFRDLGLDEVLALVEPVVLADIDRIWSDRNQIDVDRALEFNDLSLLQVLRWYLRGMDVDLAIRKVRTGIIHTRHLYLDRKRKAHVPVIEGFKAGDRVTLISDDLKYEKKKGWEGSVYKVLPNECLVVLDLDPTTSEKYLKAYDVPYAALNKSIREIERPVVKQKINAIEPEKTETLPVVAEAVIPKKKRASSKSSASKESSVAPETGEPKKTKEKVKSSRSKKQMNLAADHEVSVKQNRLFLGKQLQSGK